jgi:2'-5' RNA ligase
MGKAAGLSSLVHNALDALGLMREGSVLLRGAIDSKPGVTILGTKEMRAFPSALIPTDREQFVEQLAKHTQTSQESIAAKITGCGLFGRKRYETVMFGLTFDDKTTDVLRTERRAAIDLIDQEHQMASEYNSYPHLQLAKVLVDESMVQALRHEIKNRAMELGSISLMPIHTNYK